MWTAAYLQLGRERNGSLSKIYSKTGQSAIGPEAALTPTQGRGSKTLSVWETVQIGTLPNGIDPKVSSRQSAAYVGLGIVGTRLTAVRLISLIHFYEQLGYGAWAMPVI